jgi:hypothetical protein
LASAASQLIMVLFLTYFVLLSDQLFKRKLVEIVGTLSQEKLTLLPRRTGSTMMTSDCVVECRYRSDGKQSAVEFAKHLF